MLNYGLNFKKSLEKIFDYGKIFLANFKTINVVSFYCAPSLTRFTIMIILMANDSNHKQGFIGQSKMYQSIWKFKYFE